MDSEAAGDCFSWNARWMMLESIEQKPFDASDFVAENEGLPAVARALPVMGVETADDLAASAMAYFAGTGRPVSGV